MVVRRFLEKVEVAQAVALLESGYTQRIVAERFDVSRSVFCQAMETLPGDGRVYWTRRARPLPHDVTKGRSISSKSSATKSAVHGQIDFQHAVGLRISDQTIRNRLSEGESEGQTSGDVGSARYK